MKKLCVTENTWKVFLRHWKKSWSTKLSLVNNLHNHKHEVTLQHWMILWVINTDEQFIEAIVPNCITIPTQIRTNDLFGSLFWKICQIFISSQETIQSLFIQAHVCIRVYTLYKHLPVYIPRISYNNCTNFHFTFPQKLN